MLNSIKALMVYFDRALNSDAVLFIIQKEAVNSIWWTEGFALHVEGPYGRSKTNEGKMEHCAFVSIQSI
jgi:hypothetical protein